jgi:hypothetical protein
MRGYFQDFAAKEREGSGFVKQEIDDLPFPDRLPAPNQEKEQKSRAR